MQFVITPAAGKRLIAKAVVDGLMKTQAIREGRVVVIAGTTNGYVAEDLLKALGQSEGFQRNRFFRGITLPPKIKTTETGRLPDESAFPGDVVVENGNYIKGKTIFDVLEDLVEGDLVVKGANCVDLRSNKAGILIGHPKGGTIIAALQAVIGKRARLILPIGLEKRVFDDIDDIARLMNKPGSAGLRMMPVIGTIVTELEAIEILTGASASLVAAGGVCGAEGSVWVHIEGAQEALDGAKRLLGEVASEEAFSL